MKCTCPKRRSWCVHRARGKAWNHAPLLREAAPGAAPRTAALLEAVLGVQGREYENSNFSNVSDWVHGLSCTSPEGRTAAEDVYVAICPGGDGPKSQSWPHAALIAIPETYIERIVELARLFPSFVAMVAVTSCRPPADRQLIFSGYRKELFRTMGKRVPGAHHQLVDSSDIVAASEDSIFTVNVAQAAIRWAIYHELSHLLWSRQDALRAGRQAISELGEAVDTPSIRHSIEIGCDRVALDLMSQAAIGVYDIGHEISGSLIATLALVWDGWYLDGSRPSETHPSPTLRFMTLWASWLRYFRNEADKPLGEKLMPDAGGLLDFANLCAYERWGAGYYEPHRGGLAVDSDIEDFLRISVNAAQGRIADPAF